MSSTSGSPPIDAVGLTPGRQRWVVLGIGVAAQAASSSFQFGLPFLLPQLRSLTHGSLAQAGLLASCPTIGLMFTLILWGWAADMWGERLAMSTGLTVASFLIAGAVLAGGAVPMGILLVLAGATAASVNAASGRLIMAWFDPRERGLAMGIRQTAQPIGVAIAAVTLPNLVGLMDLAALLVPAALCLAVGVLVPFLVTDPPKATNGPPPVPECPYRHPPIWQVHGASALLIVAQFTVASYAYLYLIEAQGIAPATAGWILGATQLLGALARLAAGRWSDVVGSRLRPMRALALANAVVLLGLTTAAMTESRLAVPLLIAAAIVTVSGNGLAFTAVAEIAGNAWAGRALGAQNTVQNAVASVTPAAVGVIITATSFAGGFASAIVFPILASIAIPASRRR